MIALARQTDAPDGFPQELIDPISPSSAPVLVPITKQCPGCLEWQPLDSFRPHKRDGDRLYRASRCNVCHRRQERDRKRRGKADAEHRAMFMGWAALATAKTRRRSIERLTLELAEHFGGFAGLKAAWIREYKAATSNRRMRCVRAILELMRWTQEQAEAGMADPAAMTDEELASEAANAKAVAFVELLQHDPQKAADLAARCGYSLSRTDVG